MRIGLLVLPAKLQCVRRTNAIVSASYTRFDFKRTYVRDPLRLLELILL